MSEIPATEREDALFSAMLRAGPETSEGLEIAGEIIRLRRPTPNEEVE